MYGSNNIFTADANMLAAMTGRGSPNAVIVAAIRYLINGITILDAKDGRTQIINTGIGNTTIQMTNVGIPGQELQLIINNDAGAARVVAFAVGQFKLSVATVTGTAGKPIVIGFVSDGNQWLETWRSAAALTAT